jgi:hypothetical protein
MARFAYQTQRFQPLINPLVNWLSTSRWVVVFVLIGGIAARLWAATRGENFDFESWIMAADIFSHGGNIYAETTRYIYGPVWYVLIGVLGRVSTLFPNSAQAYRFLLPLLLTSVDIGIFLFINRHFNRTAAILFFLNPISIIISGYHVQFDNIAILLGLIAMMLWGETFETPLTQRKVAALLLLGLSLAVKHVFFVFPLWLALKQKGVWQKAVVVLLPVVIFLASFLPFWPTGQQGIIRNVFMYPAYNNGVLWNYLPGFLKLIISNQILFFSSLILGAFLFRNTSPLQSLLVYTCLLLIVTPSLNDQYLVIPAAYTSIYPNLFFFFYTAATVVCIFARVIGLEQVTAAIPQGWLGYTLPVTLLAIGFAYSRSANRIKVNLFKGWSGLRSLAAIVAASAIIIAGLYFIDLQVARQRFVSTPPSSLVTTPTDFDGKIRLLGYDAYLSDYTPGGRLKLDLYWQALIPLDHDYTVAIQLLDSANQRATGIDLLLGFDYILPYYSSRWQPSEVIRQTYEVELPNTDAAPFRVAVIVYDDMHRLPISASSVEILGDAAAITGVSVLPDSQSMVALADPTQPDLTFGGRVKLVNASLASSTVINTAQTEEGLEFRLTWQALKHPDSRLHLFLHFLDSNNMLAAQWDGPLSATFPTDTWPPLSEWQETYRLPLPAKMMPGEYTLWAGVYRPITGDRLLIEDNSQTIFLDNRFVLSTISVK